MKFLFDVFPLLLFFAAYVLFGVYKATGTAIVASVVQVTVYWLRHRKFEKLHLISLALITGMGGLTIALHDKSFIMWKPTVLHWLFAVFFLGSQYVGDKPLIQRAMDISGQSIELPVHAWRRLNLSWVFMFLLAGAVNIYFVLEYQSAETALRQAVPGITQQQLDKFNCTEDFADHARELCLAASSKEKLWVYFKVPGTIALLVILAIGQAFYLARFMKPDNKQAE